MDPTKILTVFVSGLAIGLSLAAPVGPIGVLTIRRTLAHGRWIGFISGLGTATADALYGLIGALGLTVLVRALNSQAFWLQLAGGLFLCYLGIRTFLSTPATQPATAIPTQNNAVGPAVSAYTSAFLLTLTNPATILSFIGIFAGLNIAPQSAIGTGSALIVVLGVFASSAA